MRVLLIEDSELDTELLLRELLRAGFKVTFRRVQTAPALKAALAEATWDIVLSDYKMPDFTGMEALAMVKASGLDLPFILISGAIGEEVAVEAMRHGANDYFVKRNLVRIGPAIARELREVAGRRALRASEARVRQLSYAVEQAPVSFVITDATGRIEYVNPKFTALTGYTLEEAKGQNPRVLKSGHQSAEVYRELWTTITAGREWRGELQNRAKDGRLFWELVSISPIRDAAGGITHYLAAKLDITEAKEAEERERLLAGQRDQLLAQLQQQMAVMPIACMVGDPELRVLDWNPAGERIFDFTKAEMLGRLSYGLMIPAAAEAGVRAAVASLREGTQPVRHVNENLTKDGRTIVCEWHNTPLRDSAGQFLGVLSMAQDITERMAAARQIEQQAELLDITNDAIYVRSLDGTIRFWSRGAERVYGWSREEAVGRLLSELRLQEMDADAEREGVLLRDGAWSGERWQLTKAEAGVVVFSSLTLVRDKRGEPGAVLANNTDITAKKKLEEQFLRAQRLESIGMLAAGIAHDLNNVLAPILMGVPLLADQAKSEGDKRLLKTLETSAERGAGLVRQILGFAHGISGEPQLVQVKHVIRDIAGIIRQTFPKSIVLEDEIPKDLWPVQANPTQIHQVLLNLCVNARDAMPQGGTLRMVAQNLLLNDAEASRLGVTRAGSWIALRVTDTGTGMTPDVLARIWDPFFTTKTADKGTGLGLPTVLGIVKQHRGLVTVESNPGHGSTFHVYLPAAESAAAKPADGAGAAAPRGQGELILLVDDEETIRNIGAAILTSHGYRVVTANDGAEGVAVFAARPDEFALVITDLDMPNLDGAGFARILHQVRPGLKILAWSGLGGTSRNSIVKPAEFASAFLEKPFATTTLLNLVQHLLKPEGAAR